MTKSKIVLIPFPFDDLSSKKVRPAVCLTEPIGIYRHIILAFISSQKPAVFLDTDVLIDSQSEHFFKTGLRVTSTLRLHRLMTVSLSIIQRELGQLPDQLQSVVDEKLKRLFGLQ